MKKILLVVVLAAVALAAWFYNSGITAIAILPVILLIQSILVSDNLGKVWSKASATGPKAGKGAGISVWSYIVSTAVLPFLWIAVFSMIGFFPLATIIVFLTLPVAIACAQTMAQSLKGGNTSVFTDLSDRTMNLSLIFSALLALSFLIGKFI